MESGNLDIPLQKMAVMTKSFLAIIPARGGSKGLKRKNVLPLADKPLISWTIEASLNSKYITDTYVSSEDSEILDIAKQYKAKIVKRPYFLALDDSSSESVVFHTISSIKSNHDYIVLLQPTSPLRDNYDIDSAIETLLEKNADALISVYEVDNKLLKSFVEDENSFLKGVSNNKYPFMPRQKLPKTYMSNGAIYIIKRELFIKNNSFFANKTIKFLMNKTKSIDIDTLEDFKIVESLLCKS